MKRIYLAIFTLCLITTVNAQKVSLQGIAIDLQLSQGWQVMQQQYGVALIGHNTIPGMIIITEHGYKSPQELLKNVNEGITDQSTQLMLSSQVEDLGNGTIAAEYQGYSEGNQIKAFGAATLSQYWRMGGVIVLAMVRSDLYGDQYASIVKSIAKSINYRGFMDAQAQQWATLVKGKSLYKSSSNYDNTDYTTDGGEYAGNSSFSFSSSSEVHLCSNGQYLIQSSSSSSISVSMAGMGDANSSESQNTGYWSLMNIAGTPVFRLLSDDGSVTYYAVDQYDEAGYLYIQGDRWAIGQSSRCN